MSVSIIVCEDEYLKVVEIAEPSGWTRIPLKDINDKLIRTFMLQIAVLQNHQQVPYPLLIIIEFDRSSNFS